MSIPEYDEIIEPNDQTIARREHLDALRELVGNVYPNKFDRSRVTGGEDTISNIVKFAPVAKIVGEIKQHISTLKEGERPSSEVKEALNAQLKEFGNVRVSGRMAVPPRVMGKAAFVHLSDGMERLQVYVRRDDVQGVYNDVTGSEPPASAGGKNVAVVNIGEVERPLIVGSVPPAYAGGSDQSEHPSGWEIFHLLDHGDFIGVAGFLFLTNTGELSVHVEKLQFLAKAMVPMPDKMHGIADAEIRQRQRYADLIGSSLQVEHEGLTTRQVFETRAKVISSLRHFLEDHGYIEVETPMLTPKATGAAANPFKTHHKALDIDLYARIAPELYLKRLVVGGFEKVYELNRNFRNEGISYKHNPEFTMLEFYCAYMDVNGMMDFAEELLRQSVQQATGGLRVKYKHKSTNFISGERVTVEREIDFGKFERKTMKQAVADSWSESLSILGGERFSRSWLDDLEKLRTLTRFLNQYHGDDWFFNKKRDLKGIDELWNSIKNEIQSGTFASDEPEETEAGKLVTAIFEFEAEEKLVQPTFIVDYPKSISPLSKASPENPHIAERFELFINGMEIANGFSELNDPKEQYERFIEQMSLRTSGDEEAMVLDEDYIRALSYGMPPAAGIGIGIDRLVMLLTNKHSIRDVILFPHLRPEKRDAETDGHGDAVKQQV